MGSSYHRSLQKGVNHFVFEIKLDRQISFFDWPSAWAIPTGVNRPNRIHSLITRNDESIVDSSAGRCCCCATRVRFSMVENANRDRFETASRRVGYAWYSMFDDSCGHHRSTKLNYSGRRRTVPPSATSLPL